LGIVGVLLVAGAFQYRQRARRTTMSALVAADGTPLVASAPVSVHFPMFWLLLVLGIGTLLLAVAALAANGATINDWLSAGKSLPVTLSLQTILGYALSPIAWLIGVPWQDAVLVGGFIGQKVVLNEFVAYVDLSKNMHLLQEHSRVVAAYALCGFANFSSIAIQIGGIGGLAPGRRADLARFGLRAVLGGSLATFMTATIAGVLNLL